MRSSFAAPAPVLAWSAQRLLYLRKRMSLSGIVMSLCAKSKSCTVEKKHVIQSTHRGAFPVAIFDDEHLFTCHFS